MRFCSEHLSLFRNLVHTEARSHSPGCQTEEYSIVKPVSGASLSIPAGLVSPKVLRLWVDGGGSVLVCLCDQISDWTFWRVGGVAVHGSPCVESCHSGQYGREVMSSSLSDRCSWEGKPSQNRRCSAMERRCKSCRKSRYSSGCHRLSVERRYCHFLERYLRTPTIDVAILMNRTCLIGPDSLSHIVVPGIDERGVFVWNGEELSCRFSCENGENGVGFAWGDAHRVTAGSTISGRQIRFRCESYPEASCSQ